MSIGFIHIGMMKTASTYMQNIWFRDKSYAISWKANLPYLESLRETVKLGEMNKEIPFQLKTDTAYQQGQQIVISNEAFSTAYLNDEKNQEKIPQFIDYTSRSLGRLSSHTPNLLIVIREPISWIKSMYVQAIKEGGAGSAQDFVDSQINFLKHSLDLEHIVNCYSRYFDNILILPYKILKEDEDLFWNVIAHSFNMPPIETKINERLNKSLDLKRVCILAKLNETSGLLRDTIRDSKDYNLAEEKDYLVKLQSNSAKWVHRRFVEYATDEEVDKLYSLYNMTEPSDDFLDFTIPDDLLEVIQTKFIGFLRQNIIEEYPNYYEEALEKHINKK